MAQQSENAAETVDSDDDSATCYCPLGGVMDLLSRKYAMQLICVVGALGPVRYGEVEATFGDVVLDSPEWEALLRQAGIGRYRLSWQWAFRHLLVGQR